MKPVSLLLSCVVLSCGGAGTKVETVEETALMPPPAASTSARSSNPSPNEAAAVSSDTKAPPQEGQILRQDLQRYLSNGPAGVLALVRTEPARSHGRFLGFRIIEFVHETPTTIDLRVGDVLVAVNGQPIVSPDDFYRVFQELSVASELRFDILRNGHSELLHYPIVD
jgi:type II secretory pathway component PulC